MASSKSTSKPAKAAPAVKEGRVTKPAHTPSSKSKDTGKKVVTKMGLMDKKDKKDKKAKKVKEPTPEPEPESEEDSEEDSEDDSENDSDDDNSESSADSDSDEEPAKIAPEAPKINGAAKKAVAADDDSDDDSEDDSEDGSSDSDSSDAESDEEPAAASVSKATTAGAEDEDTSDESDSSGDEAPSKPNGVKINGVAKKEDAESSDEDEEDDSEDSGSSISDSDSEASDEEEAAPPKKRKADEPVTPVTPAAKKSKTDEADSEGSKNLFVGNLSWNVDEEWLMREFGGFGELAGCRVITDRDSGRSKGFGYVEFTDAADAAKALEEMNGAMVDGRNIRLDFSSGRTPKTENVPQQRAQRFGDSRSNPSDTLFIGNISFECTNDMVSDAFAEFGTITSVRLPTDRESGQLKGFGYISFSSVEEAQGALDGMSGQQIAGRPVRLDFAGPKPENGGAGGRGGRGGFGDRGGRGGRGGFGDRGGRGGGRGGGFRGGRGGRGGGTTNRGGFGDFQGKKVTF